MPLGQQGRNIVGRKQPAKHVQECGDTNEARHPPEQVNESIAKQCHNNEKKTEDYDTEAIVDLEQLTYCLPGKHATTCRKADVHQAHRDDRYDGTIDAELD